MPDVVEGTAKLTDIDHRARPIYVKSVPPLHNSGASGS
jgi:hypothetical protein